jgi:hypothetical protein
MELGVIPIHIWGELTLSIERHPSDVLQRRLTLHDQAKPCLAQGTGTVESGSLFDQTDRFFFNNQFPDFIVEQQDLGDRLSSFEPCASAIATA